MLTQNIMTTLVWCLLFFVNMWSRKFGRLNTVNHRIELTKYSHLFHAAPCCARTKTLEHKDFKIQKQLEADVI